MTAIKFSRTFNDNSWTFFFFVIHDDRLSIYRYRLQHTEVATRSVLCKKVFLEISQNSLENTFARASFLIKLHALNLKFTKKTEFKNLKRKHFNITNSFNSATTITELSTHFK